MGISVGGIDITQTLLTNEMRLAVLEKILEHVLARLPNSVTQADIERFRAEAFKDLQAKYPMAGIHLTPPGPGAA